MAGRQQRDRLVELRARQVAQVSAAVGHLTLLAKARGDLESHRLELAKGFVRFAALKQIAQAANALACVAVLLHVPAGEDHRLAQAWSLAGR